MNCAGAWETEGSPPPTGVEKNYCQEEMYVHRTSYETRQLVVGTHRINGHQIEIMKRAVTQPSDAKEKGKEQMPELVVKEEAPPQPREEEKKQDNSAMALD